MNKRIIAIAVELIPIVTAIISIVLLASGSEADLIRWATKYTIIVSFFGFIFFFIGRKLCKKDKLVKVLGIVDLAATLYVIGIYIAAIFAFGL